MDEKIIPVVPEDMVPFRQPMEIEDLIREIIEKYSALIRSVIQAHVFPGDAVNLEDVEQEIRIKLWKSVKKGKNIEKLPSYLKKVAYTVTVDELRRMRKQAPYHDALNWGRLMLDQEGDPPVSAAAQPEARYDRMQRSQEIGRMLENLAPGRRRVLRLYAGGLSIDEICEFSGWDRTRVRHLLYRGIDDLRLLSRDGEKEGTGTGNGTGKSRKMKDGRTGKEKPL